MLFLAIIVWHLQITAQQNLLSAKYSTQQLQELLIPPAKWTPFPRITDRAGWAKVDDATMQAFIKQANGYLTYQWPSIPATTSLLIERTGGLDYGAEASVSLAMASSDRCGWTEYWANSRIAVSRSAALRTV